MKYIITEKQFKKISDLVLKEQPIPSPTLTVLPGVKINGITYNLPKIRTQQDLDAFTAVVPDELPQIVDYGKMKGYSRMFQYSSPQEKKFGAKILASIPEFLRVNAIKGISKPIDLNSLKLEIDSMSKSPALKPFFIDSPYVLEILLNPDSAYSEDAKTIFNYYKNLLNKRLS